MAAGHRIHPWIPIGGSSVRLFEGFIHGISESGDTWMSRWKLGSMVSTSMVYFTYLINGG